MKLIYIFVLTLNAYSPHFLTEQRMLDEVEIMCREAHPKAYTENKPAPNGTVVRCVIRESDLETEPVYFDEDEQIGYLGASKRAVNRSGDSGEGYRVAQWH